MPEDKLILENIPLVYYMLKKLKLYHRKEDFYDVGVIGLIKGVRTYNPDKGIEISTYLSTCIKNEVLQEIRKLNGDKKKANLDTVSLDQIVYNNGKDDPICLIDFITSDYNLEDEVIKNDFINNDILNGLNDREKIILTYSYGLFNKNILTQKELAKKLNLSQAQISRILKKAIDKIKIRKGV